jgi:ABC-type transporter Mla maintaining outer membrane lipid asymmetry ATPase subunit MlaF
MENQNNVVELREADIPRAQVASPTAVLHNVDWAAQAGDFWVIGALPGEGKTDFLCTAAGLQRPLKGRQYLFGKETAAMSEEELVAARLRIAMIFTGGRLFNGMTAAQNVALPLSYHKEYDTEELSARVGQALERTGLMPYQSKKPGQLTRNLHQRVGLARALALEPEVLIIDNPLAAIDSRQGRWWLDFLCELNRTVTVVVAVDDLRAWIDVGKQFAVLRDQRLEIIGGRDELRRSSDSLVRELLLPAFTDE